MAVTNDWGQGVTNNTIGWGKSADNATNGFGSVYASSAAGDTLLESGGTFDPDAVVYFTAVEDAGGELTLLEKDLVNQWFITEKAAGRLSNYKAVYPFKGKNSAAAAINMVNPSTYDLAFTNFIAADFTVSGVLQGDGSTKYALGPNAATIFPTNDYQFGFVGENMASNGIPVGAGTTAGTTNVIWVNQNPNQTLWFGNYNTLGTGAAYPTGTLHATYTTYSSSDRRIYNNGVQAANSTLSVTDTPASMQFGLFTRYVNGSPSSGYTDDPMQVFWFATEFEDGDMSDINESLKEMLVDPDAQAYIQEVFDQGGTLTLAQQAAVNNLVKSMKADGLWDGTLRLLPFMGGTIDSARIDLKSLTQATNSNFVDADADAKIGLQGDGSTKYLNPISDLSSLLTSSNDYQAFNFTILDDTTNSNAYYWGQLDGVGGQISLRRLNGGNKYRHYAVDGSIIPQSTTAASNGDSQIGVRYSSTDARIYVNGVQEDQETGSNSFTVAAGAVSLFALWNTSTGASNGGYSNEKKGGWILAEGFDEAKTLRLENLYKAFIQQVQDEETYDTDAAAYFKAVEDAGGTLSSNQKTAFSNFAQREKAGGRWGKIKRLYPYLGGVIDSARVDAITLAQATNNNFVDADADSTIGLQGDGSTKSLRLTETTNLILPDSTDFQIGVFRIGAVEQPSSLSRLMGHFYSSNPLGCLYLQKNSLQPQVFATDSVSAYGGVLSSNSSHIGASFSSSDLNLLLDGVVVNTNSTARSTPFSAHLMDLFSININGSSTSFSSIKSGGMFIASGLSLAETQAFESSYKTFINNITA